MPTMRLVRFDPEPDAEAPTRWHVGYEVEFADGSTRYHVTTVFASALASTDRVSVLVAARDQLTPGIAVLAGPLPDFFDVLAKSLEGP